MNGLVGKGRKASLRASQYYHSTARGLTAGVAAAPPGLPRTASGLKLSQDPVLVPLLTYVDLLWSGLDNQQSPTHRRRFGKGKMGN